jgi:hypothetical protein
MSRARIISRTAAIRSSSKNMCSVRQSPMPSAPKLSAFSAWAGVSAFVRTRMRRTRSVHLSRTSISGPSATSTVSTTPRYTCPLEPSMVIRSPCWMVATTEPSAAWMVIRPAA